MRKQSRARWLALTWMLFALLAWPVTGWCQEEEEEHPETEEETAERHEREDAAEEAEDTAAWEQTHRGFYVQGGGNYSILTTEGDAAREIEDAAGFTPPVHTTSDDSWGAGGRLGWRVMKHLAIEGQFEIKTNFEFDHDTAAAGEEQTDFRYLSGILNAKGYFPIGRFQPYGLIGGGYANAKIDPPNSTSDHRHAGEMRFGGGFDLYGNENVGVYTEAAYVLPFGDLSDFDHVAIGFGLILRFYGE
jgi:opacity protein-like surface antigen